MSRVHLDVEDWQREWVEAIVLRVLDRRLRLWRMRTAYRARHR